MINEMLELFEQCFKQARPFILENAGKVEHTSKHDGSPVTAIDIEVEKRVTATMTSRFPDIPIFGEESGYEDNLPPVCWLMDPIDGTGSFIDKTPYFTCMAVLIVNNEATASIIYNPTTDVVYTAQKGKGAYKNGTRLYLAKEPLPSKALCKGRFVETINDLLASDAVTCEKGPSGAGFGLASVAEGLIAARFQLASQGYPHDYATGALLVHEAGGAIIPVKEVAQPYLLRTFVACHPSLEPAIREHIEQLKVLEDQLGSDA